MLPWNRSVKLFRPGATEAAEREELQNVQGMGSYAPAGGKFQVVSAKKYAKHIALFEIYRRTM